MMEGPQLDPRGVRRRLVASAGVPGTPRSPGPPFDTPALQTQPRGDALWLVVLLRLLAPGHQTSEHRSFWKFPAPSQSSHSWPVKLPNWGLGHNGDETHTPGPIPDPQNPSQEGRFMPPCAGSLYAVTDDWKSSRKIISEW